MAPRRLPRGFFVGNYQIFKTFFPRTTRKIRLVDKQCNSRCGTGLSVPGFDGPAFEGNQRRKPRPKLSQRLSEERTETAMFGTSFQKIFLRLPFFLLFLLFCDAESISRE
jgi:hypothetical protein